MVYVFDTSPISTLFRNYYPKRFPTLWKNFDELVNNNLITSTREVLRELENYDNEDLSKWIKEHKNIFTKPTREEADFVKKIFSYKHFQQNVENKKMLKGGFNADPFVVAKAHVINASVVTIEKMKENSAKIPAICKHFKIPCYNLEEFMENEKWEF